MPSSPPSRTSSDCSRPTRTTSWPSSSSTTSGRGLTPELAREVAEQLHAADPLAAQLQTEYGIDEIPPARGPILIGLSAGISFAVGSSIPLLITFVAPISLDAIAVLIAVVVSLTITSIIAARSSYLSARRTIVRTLIVGLGTLGVSYARRLCCCCPGGLTTRAPSS